MLLIFGYLTFAIVAGIIASSRGRSGFGYFLLSLVVSPLIGIILAVAMPNLRPSIEREAELAQSRACPHCAEPIKRAASVCRFCGRDVAPILATPQGYPTPWLEVTLTLLLAAGVITAVAIFLLVSVHEAPTDKNARLQAAAPAAAAQPVPIADAHMSPATGPKALPKDAKPKAPAPPLRIVPQ